MFTFSRVLRYLSFGITLAILVVYLAPNLLTNITDTPLSVKPITNSSDINNTTVDAPSLEQKAILAINSSKLVEAEEIYKEMLDTNPADIRAKFGLGVVSALNGENDKATEILHEVFIQEPSKIEEILNDPKLEGLRNSKHFQDLLRIHDISIPEMNTQINSPPMPLEEMP
jgi:hypothetical protein